MAGVDELVEAFDLPIADNVTLSDSEALARHRFLSFLMEGRSVENAGLSVGWSPLKIRTIERDREMAEIISFVEQFKDGEIESAMYQMARHGNFQAAQWWLLNRRGDRWKDTKRVVIDSHERLSVEVIHSVKEGALQLLREHGAAALQPGGALDAIDVESVEVVPVAEDR